MTELNKYELKITTESEGDDFHTFEAVQAGLDAVNGFVQAVPVIGTLKLTRLPDDWTSVEMSEIKPEVPVEAPAASPEAEAIITA